jgi:pyruvate dehydrogenase E2 component (dihydrolipoamide acetyltransferase)
MSIEVFLPSLSPTMEKGKIVKWHKKVGDQIKSGEVIFEVETDKAVMEVESTDDGFLAIILKDSGDSNVGDIVGVISEKKENIDSISNEYKDLINLVNAPSNISTNNPEDTNLESDVFLDIVQSSHDKKIDDHLSIDKNEVSINKNQEDIEDIKRISPLAKNFAAQNDISKQDLFSISGSGQNSRVVQKDVKNFINNPINISNSNNSSSSSNLTNSHKSDSNSQNNIAAHKSTNNSNFPDFWTESPSVMRKSIASSLTKAVQSIPTFSIFEECLVSESFIGKAREFTGIKISLNDLIVKSCAFATNNVKKFNSLWKDENTLINYNSIDIGVAISVQNGVVVRIIKDALRKSISDISLETVKLSEESRSSFTHENYVFCISNLGSQKVRGFAATLSGTAILAIGGAYKKPVVVDNQIVIATVMDVCLTCDHRVVDGIDAASWMKYFRKAFLNPEIIIL